MRALPKAPVDDPAVSNSVTPLSSSSDAGDRRQRGGGGWHGAAGGAAGRQPDQPVPSHRPDRRDRPPAHTDTAAASAELSPAPVPAVRPLI